MNEKQRTEIVRAKIILSGVTGQDEHDEENIRDAYRALCRVLDQQGSKPVQALQIAAQPAVQEGRGWITKAEAAEAMRAMYELPELLSNPEDHYPGNFDTPQRANALLTGLCQDAAKEIAKLQAEVLEQCRIIAMGAEREDALRAELTRLKASIALEKMAENAREIGLDYEPAPVQEVRLWAVFCGGCRKEWSVPYQHPGKSICAECEAKCKDTPPTAQPAVQEGRDWSLLEATQESLREHMAEIKRLKAAQPEIKLKGKNHG